MRLARLDYQRRNRVKRVGESTTDKIEEAAQEISDLTNYTGPSAGMIEQVLKKHFGVGESPAAAPQARQPICKGSYKYDKEAQAYRDVCSLCGIHSDEHPEEITLEDSARSICASLGILPALPLPLPRYRRRVNEPTNILQ
jgi:hypothetical protein